MAATTLADVVGFARCQRGNGRGLVGALAAVGAGPRYRTGRTNISPTGSETGGALSERSTARASARRLRSTIPRCGTLWPCSGYPVCVPRTPCPISRDSRRRPDRLSRRRRRNRQRTHRSPSDVRDESGNRRTSQDATLDAVTADSAYRVTGTVVEAAETRAARHVFSRSRRRRDPRLCGLRADEALPKPGAGAPRRRRGHRLRRGRRRHAQTGEVRGPRPRADGTRDAGLPGLRPDDENRRTESGCRCRDCGPVLTARLRSPSSGTGTRMYEARRSPAVTSEAAGPWRSRTRPRTRTMLNESQVGRPIRHRPRGRHFATRLQLRTRRDLSCTLLSCNRARHCFVSFDLEY